MPSSYALGTRFERFVRRQVATGRYASASEVVRAALRLLEQQERRRAEAVRELRRAIREGLEGGDAGPVEEVLARVRARIRSR